MDIDFTSNISNNLVHDNRELILQGISGSMTPEQVESSTTFANYLNHVGINPSNYKLFLKLIETNNKWIIDALIGKKKAELTFTSLKPDPFLINKAFELLTSWHPGQIYKKVLLAVIGIIQYVYYNPDDGYRIYPIEISDVNNLGKFLEQGNDQYEEVNELLLELLDCFAGLGEHSDDNTRNIIAKHSYNIRIAYFDNTKTLMDVIPKVLLVKLKREDQEVKPSKEFISFYSKKYNN